MFQQLRQGNQFYILHKGENYRLEVAQVTNVSQPQPKYPNQVNPYMPMPGQEMLVDVQVKTADQAYDLGGLPAVADFVDLTTSGKPMIVASNREAMLAQVENILANSRQIVESVDYHRGVLSSCETILQQLNPGLAERKMQEQRIDQLSSEVKNLRGEIRNDIRDLIAEFLSAPRHTGNGGGNGGGNNSGGQKSAPSPKNN